jgi:hypothetical protein
MSRKYHLRPIRQASRTLCFPTALLMIDMYAQSLVGTTGTSSLQTRVISLAYIENAGLFTEKYANQFAQTYAFSSESIDITPERFDSALNWFGPFAYIGDLPEDRPYKHTLVVSGITKHKDLWSLDFINPWVGKNETEEFYSVLTKFVPYDTGSSNKVKVYYIPDFHHC